MYLIPAFSGLGAPHWDMNRKASVTGLTFGTNKNHVVRAALESISYQIMDVVIAMEGDTTIALQQLMIDGGITSNLFVLQFLSDLLHKPVINIGQSDVSALGAAYVAGLKAGVFRDVGHLSQLNTEKKIIKPSSDNKAKVWYEEWRNIIAKT